VDSRVFFVDKAPGGTSHDEVAALRRELGRGTKVGHAGTLDPFATGLLILLAGRATRAQSLFMALGKTYEVTARFGVTSTTGDTEGELHRTGRVPEGDLLLPTGRFEQTPPAWSAVKVGGVRAYRLARAGIEPELEPRRIQVRRFEETGRSGADRSFRIECSSGTYVRSLIADLGDAYCTSLRRTAIGPFQLDRVAGTDVALAAALSAFTPAMELPEAEAMALVHGRTILDPRDDPASGEVLVTAHGELRAVAGPTEDGRLRTLIGFPPD